MRLPTNAGLIYEEVVQREGDDCNAHYKICKWVVKLILQPYAPPNFLQNYNLTLYQFPYLCDQKG